MRCPILQMYFGLCNGRSFSIKANLKWPLSRSNLFKIQFYLEWRENRGSSQRFHINKLKLRDMKQGDMHDNTKCNIYKVKNYMHSRIISEPFPFTKVKLKWPLSRGSCFKIHFCLKFWENRGSSQNFHGVLFSRDGNNPKLHNYSISIINTYYLY